MNLFTCLAQAGTSIDAKIGLSLAGLIGSLGAATVAITVTHSLVVLLRRKTEGQRRIIEHFQCSHAKSQRTFQDQLERLSDRHQECQDDFQTYIDHTCDAQNMFFRDVIVAMKAVESANAGSSVTTQ